MLRQFLLKLGQAALQIPPAERAVLALGVLLRLYLTVVNAEANDDHLSVIRVIADEHRLPRLREAWEGFQPKLYHGVVAILWNLNPWPSWGVEVRLAQLVACGAGIAMLFVLRAALARRTLSPQTRLLAFAFVALNPTLIGLNAQATNDSFVILFGTVALDWACEFFRTGSRRAFVAMSAAVVLAALSKGNGLVVFIAITATLALAAIRGQAAPVLSRGRVVRLAAAFAAVFLVSVTAFGAYRPNWEDTGNPFATNGPRSRWPHLLKRTYPHRPGATSIADTYLTFRFVDMLQHPWTTNQPAVYPLHRTSLWSQLYGRAHAAHFAQHPPSWRGTSVPVVSVTRLILVVALVPTALLLAGMARALAGLKGRRGRAASPGARLQEELLALTAFGFIAFVVVYSLTYRDFSTMKAEFLFPGLLAYLVFFAAEVERTDERLRHRPGWRAGVRYALVGLLALYVADIVTLAAQLT